MDRQLPWLVFGLVVVLVVTVGSIGLALVLPNAVADGSHGPAAGRDQAGWPFSWDGQGVVGARGMLAPLWLLLLVAVPLSLLGLAVTGLVWANRAGPAPVARRQSPCAACGQALEEGWSYCPHCGEQREKSADGQ